MNSTNVQICNNVTWNSVERARTSAYFPDSGIHELVELGIASDITTANFNNLIRKLSPAETSDQKTTIYTLPNNPDIVVRVGDSNFANLAVNVALGHALSGTQYAVPTYLAAIMNGPYESAIVMHRAAGIELANILTDNSKAEKIGHDIRKIAEPALKGLGINSVYVGWDLNPHNLITADTDLILAGDSDARVSIIDQESVLPGGPGMWRRILEQTL